MSQVLFHRGPVRVSDHCKTHIRKGKVGLKRKAPSALGSDSDSDSGKKWAVTVTAEGNGRAALEIMC